MHMIKNSYVFWALLRRDLTVMKKTLVSDLIDAIIVMILSIITFGKLLPLIGLKPSLIAPLYIGSNLFFIIVSRGYAFALNIIYKITFEGLGILSYQLTLPIDRKWLFAEYVIYFIIETSILTLPLLLIGTFILSTMIPLTIHSWFLFLCMYLLMLIFLGIFFIASAFAYTFDWFKANLWVRRIDFLLVLSSTFFPWQTVYEFSPKLSYLMLLNPVTYAMEGMRAAFFGTPTLLPLWVCFVMLIISIGFVSIWLHTSIRKTLDPI